MEAEEPIISYGQLNPDGEYTYWDYLKWQFEERVELIRGKIIKMSPAPGSLHQRVSFKLGVALDKCFQGKSYSIFAAPFDVRLPIPSAKKDTTVVQPDLCVICDPTKIDERGCKGAPDLVIEIVSPGNSTHEMDTKFHLYEESGVKEYWIVQASEKTILVHTLQNGKYIGLAPITEGHVIKSNLFTHLQVNVNDIF